MHWLRLRKLVEVLLGVREHLVPYNHRLSHQRLVSTIHKLTQILLLG